MVLLLKFILIKSSNLITFSHKNQFVLFNSLNEFPNVETQLAINRFLVTPFHQNPLARFQEKNFQTNNFYC